MFLFALVNCRWEVPLPHVLRAIYMHKEGTDPRFIKLEPVFKCSMLKRGGLQRYASSFILSRVNAKPIYLFK